MKSLAHLSFGLLTAAALAMSGCQQPAAAPTPIPTSAPAPTPLLLPILPTPTLTLAQAPTPVVTQSPQAQQTDSACSTGSLTPSQTEGPYFKPGSPERKSLLEQGVGGVRLVVAGQVLSRDCKPIAGARLDFWQTNDQGEYDNAGYRLRGHQLTDSHGQYSLETVVPGLYPGRTRHIHVRVSAPDGPILTTQLYLPGEAQNSLDGIFNKGLIVSIQDTADGRLATFNFVLDIS